MGKKATALDTSEFVILGPTLSPGNKVLEAIHALYYLPENFKLIFTGPTPVDRSFYNQIVSLIERDELSHRVHFTDRYYAQTAHAKLDEKSGDTAEAIASYILAAAR